SGNARSRGSRRCIRYRRCGRRRTGAGRRGCWRYLDGLGGQGVRLGSGGRQGFANRDVLQLLTTVRIDFVNCRAPRRLQVARKGVVNDERLIAAARAGIERQVGDPAQGMLSDSGLVIAWQELDVYAVGFLRDSVVEHLTVELGDDRFVSTLNPQDGDAFGG